MVSEHVEWYGSYAIGLKRSALRKIGASPVFYVHSQTRTLPGDVDGFRSNPSIGFLKQYYGRQFKKSERAYRRKYFYDEKEWRVFSGKAEVVSYSDSAHLDEMRRDKDMTVPTIDSLKITTDMIEYIILKTPDDFMEFDEFLRTNFKDKRDSLLTKILYYSQIKKDF